MKLQKIIFKGQDYLLCEGAITTKDLFEEGRASLAHMFDDGRILRFNKQIGTREDVTFTGKFQTVRPKATALDSMMFNPSWLGPIRF